MSTTSVKSQIGSEDIKWWDGYNDTFTRRNSTGGTSTLNSIGYEVDVAAIYGSLSDESINLALLSIKSNSVTLTLKSGSWVISNDLTIPKNVNIKFTKGAICEIATTKTLTINGTIEAGLYQVFSCTGTGKVVFGNGAVKEVYVEWWGGIGDDSTDNTNAIQAAFDAFPVVKMVEGVYRVLSTIYLNSSTLTYNYQWSGIGLESEVDFRDFSDGDYCVKLNETSGGDVSAAYPSQPHLRITDLRINATNSTTPDFMKVRNCSVITERVRFDQFDNVVVTGTEYCDSNLFRNIYVAAGTTDGYFYTQNGFGDNTVIDQVNVVNALYADPYYHMDCGLAHITGAVSNLSTYNLAIRNCNGGRIKLNRAYGVTIDGWHCETSAPGTRLLHSLDSTVTMRDSELFNNGDSTTAPVLIQSSSGTSTAVLENNCFASIISEAVVGASYTVPAKAAAAAADVEVIEAYSYRPVKLTLKNNYRTVSIGASLKTKLGIKVTGTPAEIATICSIGDSMRLLSGEVSIVRHNQSMKVIPINGHKIGIPRVETAITLTASNDTVYPSNLTAGTYYYKSAILIDDNAGVGLHTVASAETSILTADNKAIKLLSEKMVPHTVLRIWRGVETTVYTHYVDIPVITGSEYLYDCGDHISGFTWQTSSIPSVPAVLTIKEGTKFIGGFREFYLNLAVPSSAELACVVGDIYWRYPSVGQPAYWVCTVAGTGATATFRAGPNL